MMPKFNTGTYISKKKMESTFTGNRIISFRDVKCVISNVVHRHTLQFKH